MRTSAKNRHLPGWCTTKFRIMQYLAKPTAATLKGRGCALQQNIDKTTKDKNQDFFDNVSVWSSCFAFWFDSSFCDLRISSLKRVQTWKSQVWHYKDPISKILKKHVLDPGQKSWIRIQDPRSKILKSLCWKTLDPAIPFGSQISALDPRKVFWISWILYRGPRFLPWNQDFFPKAWISDPDPRFLLGSWIRAP